MKLLLAPPPAPLKPRDDGTFAGLGFETVYNQPDGYGYYQDGSWHGMRAFLKRNKNGVSWVMTYNASMQPDQIDAKLGQTALREVHDALDRLRELPRVDLFKNFPE